jgi:hypothetical protein
MGFIKNIVMGLKDKKDENENETRRRPGIIRGLLSAINLPVGARDTREERRNRKKGGIIHSVVGHVTGSTERRNKRDPYVQVPVPVNEQIVYASDIGRRSFEIPMATTIPSAPFENMNGVDK